ncbi:MAG: hypothetical protein ACR2LI_11400 [Propionibacteriaceae bacterium]
MSNAQQTVTPKVTIGAGTAFKIGFFGALGATVFSIILSVIFVIIALVLGLSLAGLGGLFNN